MRRAAAKGAEYTGTANPRRSGQSRDAKVIATVACSLCGAPVGEPCRQHGSHQDRPLASRTHSERRKLWQMVRSGEVK